MYFDTHAHYYDDAFDADRDEVLSALPAAGVELALCPGCDLVSSRQSVALAERYPHLYAAVGFHPENLEGVSLDQLSEIEAMAAHRKVKAIGEIGLDYYWEKDPDKRKLQRDFCSAQLSLAEKLDLPVIFHDREAHKDSLDMVRAHPNARGVFHCYSGGVEDAKTLVIMGWMVSFTGVVTFKNARRALEVIEWLPMDRIMIETDAPYMAPEPYRGKRNDSRYVFRMAEAIAQVKGLTAEEVGRITTENGKRFFNIP
ncbi:hydrolase, TatD family [Pseudoflavonifractor capillosus ATCC 29799]|uniref:Hydrolase, TatD family n=1 Tax=Pseudoflavonifractor capillosus ATCC 29799 TaxID=411467 RepID=A6NYG6_9FIRM|nr:TatD family hydrolase [Pseudoflavonifractor capillosus]EDM98932.1 hydrolase, TatD family [Pseudoflavonifractor capillosus ATCC 29799]